MAWSLKSSGGWKAMQDRVAGLRDRSKAENLLPAIGRRVVLTEIPLVFRAEGPGWKKNRMRGGQALRDRGILMKSFLWRMEGPKKLVIGTAHPGAHALNTGMTIVPKTRQYLTIPFGPNLSTSERLTFKLRNFKNVFFFRKGPRLVAMQRIGNTTRLIALLVKRVKIEKREFLSWRLYGKSAEAAGMRYIDKGLKT